MEANFSHVFGMTNGAGDPSSLFPRTGVPGGGRADFKITYVVAPVTVSTRQKAKTKLSTPSEIRIPKRK